jgi:hypothetical protein
MELIEWKGIKVIIESIEMIKAVIKLLIEMTKAIIK